VIAEHVVFMECCGPQKLEPDVWSIEEIVGLLENR
jgi:hypothetical protein